MKTSKLKKAHEKIERLNDFDFLYALDVITSNQEAVYQISDKQLQV